jgi:DNA-binding NtrC family response regulator
MGAPLGLAEGTEPRGSIDLIEGVLQKPYQEARDQVISHFEARYFDALLKRCNGNVSKAARVARMNRSYLTGLFKRLNLR